MIEVTNLVKRYGKNTVLNQASFTIQEGQLTTILGPSGCGKSTMLRCMNRLERFDRGSLKIGDVEVQGTEQKQLSTAEEKELTRRLRARVGIVFQNFNLFPHLTAVENVVLPLIHGQRMKEAEAVRTAMKFLDRVGLAQKALELPERLSGGQQQRVAIARALALRPLHDAPQDGAVSSCRLK